MLSSIKCVLLVGFLYLLLQRTYPWWSLCTFYYRGGTSGGVYVPFIMEDVPLVEFMYLVSTCMPGERVSVGDWGLCRYVCVMSSKHKVTPLLFFIFKLLCLLIIITLVYLFLFSTNLPDMPMPAMQHVHISCVSDLVELRLFLITSIFR